MPMVNPAHITTMTQNIDTVRGTPWEQVGSPLPPGASVDETLELAGLGWEVVKRQAWVDLVPVGYVSEEAVLNRSEHKGPAHPGKVKGNYVLLRSDQMVPISPFCGPRYKPIQNQEAFEVFRDFCDAGNMTMETAGSLHQGQHIWGLARIEGDYELCDGEIIRGYFLLMQSHVYGSALRAMFTPVRYPGGHTLVQAVNRKMNTNRTYRMSHSRVFNAKRIDEIKQVMGTAKAVLAEFVDKARELSQTHVDDHETIMYFIEVFHPTLYQQILEGLIDDIPEVVEDLRTWDRSNRNLKKAPDFLTGFAGADKETCKGTVWGLVNATNHAFDHEIGSSVDTRLTSSWIGANARKKLKALHSAMNKGNRQ